MRTCKCKCGDKIAMGSDFPPCNVCDKCGTAPGYANSEAPPHRFKKQFNQNTGEPFLFCMACGRKEVVKE